MRNASRNIKLLAAVGFIVALAAVPATISFSQLQQQPSSVPEPQQPGDAGQTNNDTTINSSSEPQGSNSNDITTNNQSSSSSSSSATATMGNNQTTTGVNQTAPANTTASAQEEEEERATLARSLRENITSGDVKVLMVTASQQPDVPAQHEQRDIDPLGLVNFTDAAATATTTMRIMPPDYASGENLTSTLYKEGKLSFIFENLTLQEPDDVDVLFISKDATEMRTPVAIGDDDTGIDNEFRIPATLKDDGSYLVLVTMHWSEIQQDVIMAIDGRSVQVEER